MRIMIIGSTGMLGSAVGKYFLDKPEYDVFLTYRDSSFAYGKNKVYFDIIKHNIDKLFDVECDYYINCSGVIKQKMMIPGKQDILINSIFPYELSKRCHQINSKLIHVSTDCVFSGHRGKYTEDDEHDCLDFYGKSKSLGEPTNCMVLRTSIIGEEIAHNVSFIEWAKSNKGKKVMGYSDHFWNGITTLQYAKICKKIISLNLYNKDKFHIFSPDDVSKLNLLRMINRKYHLNLNISSFETGDRIDRTLRTKKNLNDILNIDSLEKQIYHLGR